MNRLAVILMLLALAISGVVYSADRVIFGTAGSTPTAGETADIAQLKEMAQANYEIRVVNAARVTKRNLGTAAYMAGTIPTVYKRDGGAPDSSLYPLLDPDNPPTPPNLPSTQAMVYSGQVIPLPGGGSVTPTVSGNTVTAATYVAPDAS
jgi:hypothetical protein